MSRSAFVLPSIGAVAAAGPEQGKPDGGDLGPRKPPRQLITKIRRGQPRQHRQREATPPKPLRHCIAVRPITLAGFPLRPREVAACLRLFFDVLRCPLSALADKNEEAKAKAELDIAALSHTCGSCHASVYSLLTVGSGGGYVTVDGGSFVGGGRGALGRQIRSAVTEFRSPWLLEDSSG